MSIQTALDRSIDYSRANPLDPHWLPYWRILIDAAYARTYEKTVAAEIAMRIGQMLLPYIETKRSLEIQSDMLDRIEVLARLRQPWLPKREEAAKQEADEFRELWKEHAGFSIDDDAALAEWEKKVENVMKSQSELGGEASAEARRTAELIRQRAAALRDKRRKQRGH